MHLIQFLLLGKWKNLAALCPNGIYQSVTKESQVAKTSVMTWPEVNRSHGQELGSIQHPFSETQ